MAAEKSYYTELLLGSSQKLQTIRTEWDCLRLTAEQLSRMFDRPVIYALNDADKELDFRIEPADEHTLLEKLSTEEIGVAKWVQKNNKHAGATTNTLPDSKWLFLSVRGTRGVMGIVGVPIAGYVVPDAFEKNLMVALLGECGLSPGAYSSGGGAEPDRAPDPAGEPPGQSAPGGLTRSAHTAHQYQRQCGHPDGEGSDAQAGSARAAVYRD